MNHLKKLQQNPKLHNALKQLGADWLVTDELQREMESFTCIMYGQARMTSVDAVRAKTLRKMVGAEKVLDLKSNVDPERLPPPKVCLIPHLQRANDRVACYKRVEAIIESPKPYDPGMGWEKRGGIGTCLDNWTHPPSPILLLRYWLREQSQKSRQFLTK